MDQVILAITDISVNIPLLFPSFVLAMILIIGIVGAYYQNINNALARRNKALDSARSSLYMRLNDEQAKVRDNEVQIENLKGAILGRDDTIAILRRDATREFCAVLRDAIAAGDLGAPIAPEDRANTDQLELFEESKAKKIKLVDGIASITT